jgi:hypothetical protein
LITVRSSAIQDRDGTLVTQATRVQNLYSSPHVFIAVLIAEVFALYVLKFPLLYNFNNFAFWDSGAFLVTHYLLQQGHHPFTYFGWQYGLLPLLIQELGFRLLGASPASFLCLSVPCFVTVALVMGRIALLEGGTAARVLLIFSLPLILAFEPDLPHALEPALLSWGLLSQAKAKQGQALALSTAACFTKPSMGYLFGLILLVCAFRHWHLRLLLAAGGQLADASGKSERRAHVNGGPLRTLIPAICTALGLILLLSMVFGLQPVLRSLLPVSGARAYHALHFGWRGTARELLYFPGVKLGYYLGTPVGFWSCATLYLIVAAAALVCGAVKKNGFGGVKYESVLTCAVLHLGFIALFFGSPASWTYYAYVLIAGIIATETTWAFAPGPITALCVLAVLANYTWFGSALKAWRTMQRSSATAGLFVSPAERNEWTKISSATEHLHPALLMQLGGAQVLFGWLSKPTGAFMIPGVASDAEVKRETLLLGSAGAVIIPTIPDFRESPVKWKGPEFRNALAGATAVFKGTYFEVYERRATYQPSD